MSQRPDTHTHRHPRERNGEAQGAARRDEPQGNGHADHGGRRSWRERPGLVATVIAIVLVVVVGGILLWRHSRNSEATDDAFIDVVAQRVSPQVAGRVQRVAVVENQDVAADAVLVEIDPADFQNRLTQARAGVAQAEAQVAEAEAQRAVAEAQREQARAREQVAAANADNAARDLQRFRDLRAENAGAVSPQQLDRATAQAGSTAAELGAAGKGTVAAEAQVTHAGKQADAARAARQSAAAQVAEAELQLAHASVRAAAAGRIARLSVAAGNYVQPGADLMAVVPRDVYVTANFKETQLTHLRRGQPVEIKVDSFPDLRLTGRVDGIQPATGQVFDILPSQNAAGNWVKVVQRVPVKITLDRLPDDPAVRLAPGMSVTATVNVH